MTNGVEDRISAIRVLMTAALGLTALLMLAVATTQSVQAQTYSVLFQFRAGVDGTYPEGTLVLDSKNNLYGTTYADGAFAYGTVFKLTPAGKETVLHSFTGTGGDGEYPYAGVVRDVAGNLYGATFDGGTYGGICGGYGCGTVFKVDKTGKETVLHEFTGSPDGLNPFAGLVRDAAENLYGTTWVGGSHGLGTVFKVDSAGNETVLYSFGSQDGDGYLPYAGVIRDAAGNLYGTASGGGTYGVGTVFKVDTAGNETVLYSFGSQSGDGNFPWAGLVRDSAGNLYGTTEYGGGTGFGTVFRLDSTGKETVLYSFGGGADGGNPQAALVRDKLGNLYGTTIGGGSSYFGTVFKLDTTGKETVLHSFTGGDGKIPYAGLVRDAKGNLYGATAQGGAYGGGVVFKIAP